MNDDLKLFNDYLQLWLEIAKRETELNELKEILKKSCEHKYPGNTSSFGPVDWDVKTEECKICGAFRPAD